MLLQMLRHFKASILSFNIRFQIKPQFVDQLASLWIEIAALNFQESRLLEMTTI
jgi:hypothetical protein